MLIEKYNELVKNYYKYLSPDVLVIGTGISGLVAANELSKLGYNVTVVDKYIRFDEESRSYCRKIFVASENVIDFLNDINVGYKEYDGKIFIENFELTIKLLSILIDRNVTLLLDVNILDLIFSKDRVSGALLSIGSDIHVSEANALLDATGIDCVTVKILEEREKDLDIRRKGSRTILMNDSKAIVEYTGKLIDGLFLSGISVAEVYNLPKPGINVEPLIESGKRVAEIISEELSFK